MQTVKRLVRQLNLVWVVILVAACAITYVLSEEHMIIDPLLVAVLMLLTNIASLIEGRRQKSANNHS